MSETDPNTAFRKAFLAAQAAFPLVPKTARNEHFRSYYATLASVVDAVRGPLNSNDISFHWREEADPRGPEWVRIVCVLEHVDGAAREVAKAAPLPKQGNPLHATGSVQTYLQRYTLALATGVATVEDTDGNGIPEPKPDKPNIGPLLDAIRAAASEDELVKLKPQIGRLPPGPERQAVISESAQQIQRLKGNGHG